MKVPPYGMTPPCSAMPFIAAAMPNSRMPQLMYRPS
jgi:hypothetical protein